MRNIFFFLPADTTFWIGRGPEPDAAGAPVHPDDVTAGTPLRRYRNETVVLQLPEGTDVYQVDYLALWSKGIGR